MGFFKGIKDMKEMAAAAPGMIEQAQMLGAQAQQLQYAQQQQAYAAQQQTLAAAQSAGVASGTDVLAPVAGVTVEQYVAIVKGIAAYNYDQSMLPTLAAQHGIDRASWDTAAIGFNARVTSSPAFAQRFNALYRAA